MSDIDPTKVRAVFVAVECPQCDGRRHLPGGKYRDQGEVVNCPICDGSGTLSEKIPLSMLYDLLFGKLQPSRREQDQGGGEHGQ